MSGSRLRRPNSPASALDRGAGWRRRRAGLLGGEQAEALEDLIDGVIVVNDGDDLHLGAAARAKERVDLVDALHVHRARRPAPRPSRGVHSGEDTYLMAPGIRAGGLKRVWMDLDPLPGAS